MILVFGGTTEGKKVAAFLEKEACPYFYSTKTKIDFQSGAYGTYRYGAFTADALVDFCEEHSVQVIIHASHPFAEELHQTIYNASLRLGIPVIRFERNYPERVSNELISYFSSYQDVIRHLTDHNIQHVLALTGVQTMEKLRPYWQTHPTFFRILPRESSVELAERSGFPKENLILAFPSEDMQHELDVIKKHHIKALITKESGDSGFLTTKINVALELNIPLFIIQRCALPASFITVKQEKELAVAILKTEIFSPVERMKNNT